MTDETPPDIPEVLAPLKEFQQQTAKYVFNRLYTDEDYTRRFLIADEVGLGKTLVARAVIAQTIQHLWDDLDRVDIVYVCSNSSIARQNLDRLVLSDDQEHAYSSRITLLPKETHSFEENKVNYISFTPGTSFDLKSSLGRMEERVVLYHLLREPWDLEGMAPLNVLQGRASHQRFRSRVANFDVDLDEQLSHSFIEALEDRPALKTEFKDLCDHYVQFNSQVSESVRKRRRDLIGDIRNVLASVCVDALEPDLIILDEFQRFKHLLEGDTEEGDLAQRLFTYSNAAAEARVLLLSATPYKMYTMAHERDENHLADFVRTLEFLVGPDAAKEIQELLDSYRRSLYQQHDSIDEQLLELKTAIESRLSQVMVRTERLAASPDRNGMLTEIPSNGMGLQPPEVQAYLELRSVNELLEGPSIMNYWKSSPYLLNFMNDYSLKRKFRRALDDGGVYPQLVSQLSESQYLNLSASAIESYERVELRNATLRSLVDDIIETGAWRLLWLPPSLPYYEPGGPFGEPDISGLTKRLVFSSWQVVPKSIAAMVSYEAERRIVSEFDPEASYSTGRNTRGYLLRIAENDGRLTGMPLFSLLYPSVTLATIGDPSMITPTEEGRDRPSQETVRATIADRIESRLQPLLDRVPHDSLDTGGPHSHDEAWYWAAPLLLDLENYETAITAWLGRSDLASLWQGELADRASSSEHKHWDAHIARFRQMAAGEIPLGAPPDDLVETLTDIALGGPATCALRALTRIVDTEDESNLEAAITGAAQVGWGFRSVFNLPETTSLIRSLHPAEPYWRRIPEYCRDGNFQAVLDEWVHMLNDFGLADEPPEVVATTVSERMVQALSLRTASAKLDDVQVHDGDIDLQEKGIRCHFGLQFGDVEDFDSSTTIRTDQVRRAFNSPFWPFVLATTSVGQEGLDFHPYCHAVVHWNLPSNPVDLEQREGRVHRYKGHAVRKNVARAYQSQVLPTRNGVDVWSELFEHASRSAEATDTDLVPYWVFTNSNGESARIERHAPVLPVSREEQRLTELKQSLAVYRMAFGQPRQDDLVEYLLQHLSEDELGEQFDDLRIDLSPPQL
ncbi:C-terminal helicase domain-containing protein [Halomarina pelagica]|uniref:C-terminal helicase domain-containing protein n=1 Tax=Halomarina pelagica TaxID=2961599 RepID=UPI0020C41904|nr:DEAD/DEAH box helicase [Halomarina sp. BND7]